MKLLTQEKVRHLFNYDPETGVLTWKNPSPNNTQLLGREVGRISQIGYRVLRIDKKTYPAHRVIWLFMTGNLPETIDHINRVKHDNRFCNLRAATKKENLRNKPIYKNNTSGVPGVHQVYNGKWCAIIGGTGNTQWLGTFTTKEDAVRARLKAETIQFKEFAPNHSLPATLQLGELAGE